ncbi:MAG: homocysteine S-methyltransferase family protein, partial [Oligoflexia bacterium]|nr:homocysteine S-methyltransferase family protein [Oligoflexia bacterium]
MNNFLEFSKKHIVIFDGGMGTSIQSIAAERVLQFGGEHFKGLNEMLNLFDPEVIANVHQNFLLAGANVLECNSFGANAIILREYGEAALHYHDDLNRSAVRIAMDARTKFQREQKNGQQQPIWIAASIGPATKMPSLGQISFDEMYATYYNQVKILLEEGVDLLAIETSQDLMQAKIALIAINDLLNQRRKPVVMVSFTLGNSGTTLSGSNLETIVRTIAPFSPDIIGINCALGPRGMFPFVANLRQSFSAPALISIMPNAGLPELKEGKTIYNEDPDTFAAGMVEMVRRFAVDIVGGCCGTSDLHIRALRDALSEQGLLQKKVDEAAAKSKSKGKSKGEISKAFVTSLYQHSSLLQSPPPFIIGERANASGSKVFKEMLWANQFQEMVSFANAQEREGAHAIDISLAQTGRDECSDTKDFYTRASSLLRLPVMIDSTRAMVMETALKLLPGRAIINSVNLEDGGEKLKLIADYARRFRSLLVALTIDEEGMAITPSHKLKVFKRLSALLQQEHELETEEVLYDFLTFTVASGDKGDRNSARYTLEAISAARELDPKLLTVLGVSNVSYGLSNEIRPYLNTIFLQMALESGLSAAIVHSGKILPYH